MTKHITIKGAQVLVEEVAMSDLVVGDLVANGQVKANTTSMRLRHPFWPGATYKVESIHIMKKQISARSRRDDNEWYGDIRHNATTKVLRVVNAK